MKALACRCEDVTLHELDEAISRGYDDLDSLKRYTGFGTGWCQGKWCLALCTGRLVEKVSRKRGAGSVPILPITPRPPFHPVSLAKLAGLPDPPTAGGRDESASAPGPEASEETNHATHNGS